MQFELLSLLKKVSTKYPNNYVSLSQTFDKFVGVDIEITYSLYIAGKERFTDISFDALKEKINELCN